MIVACIRELMHPPFRIQHLLLRSFDAGGSLRTLHTQELSLSYCKASESNLYRRTLDIDMSRRSSPLDQTPEELEGAEWPEENLSSTIDERGGFYPVRLGETFDDGRFVVTKKLGWGGFSSVWLARDRKYVLLPVFNYYEVIGY